MKIVIIGDGKVGYKLAKQLSSEKYDIILIDNNEEKLRKSIERMDVFCVAGEGGSVEVQQRADVPHADLVIACTSTDECNMLSCLIARRLGARHTIARVRNPIYYKQIDFLKKHTCAGCRCQKQNAFCNIANPGNPLSSAALHHSLFPPHLISASIPVYNYNTFPFWKKSRIWL